MEARNDVRPRSVKACGICIGGPNQLLFGVIHNTLVPGAFLTAASSARIYVIPTNEELPIARDTYRIAEGIEQE